VSSVQAIVISIQPYNRTESQVTELTQIVSNQALRAARFIPAYADSAILFSTRHPS